MPPAYTAEPLEFKAPDVERWKEETITTWSQPLYREWTVAAKTRQGLFKLKLRARRPSVGDGRVSLSVIKLSHPEAKYRWEFFKILFFVLWIEEIPSGLCFAAKVNAF